jgi:hypothetical protein
VSAWDLVLDQERVSLSISPQDSELVVEEKLDELTDTPPPLDRVVDFEAPWESVCEAETPWLWDVVSALDRVLEEKELRDEEDDVIVWAGVTDHELDVTWWAGVVDSLWVVCAGVVDWPAVVCAPVTVLP